MSSAKFNTDVTASFEEFRQQITLTDSEEDTPGVIKITPTSRSQPVITEAARILVHKSVNTLSGWRYLSESRMLIVLRDFNGSQLDYQHPSVVEIMITLASGIYELLDQQGFTAQPLHVYERYAELRQLLPSRYQHAALRGLHVLYPNIIVRPHYDTMLTAMSSVELQGNVASFYHQHYGMSRNDFDVEIKHIVNKSRKTA